MKELVKALEKIRKSNRTVVGYSTRLQDELVRRRPSGRQAVRIYVALKRKPRLLKRGQLLPEELFGIPVDVVPIGQLVDYPSPVVTPLSSPRGRHRPLIGGITTSGPPETGTLGYFCKDGNGTWYALSCAHVYGPTSGAVLQPGVKDSGVLPDDQIAVVTRSISNNLVDAAIARIDERARGALNGLTAPTSVGGARSGMRVRKTGRTSGVTSGFVFDDAATIFVSGVLRQDQLLLFSGFGTSLGTWFGREGDSGSLVMSDQRQAVGLLTGGGRGCSACRGLASSDSRSGSTGWRSRTKYSMFSMR